jgi:hypothetical protein
MSFEIPYILTDSELEAAISQEQQRIERKRKMMIERYGNIYEPGHFDLTDEMIEKVRIRANKDKYYDQKLLAGRMERIEREARQMDDLRSEWSYDRFYKLISEECRLEGKSLIVNPDTIKVIKSACFRLSGNERYESELGLSFKKGLILRGPTGLGKTSIWKWAMNNPIVKIQFHTMQEISESIREFGEYTRINYRDGVLVYLDDVGTEYATGGVTKHFGSEINWFKDFIETYYDKYPGQFNRLIISTNDNGAEIERKYGKRVRSRMAEMFSVLDLTGKDLRRL